MNLESRAKQVKGISGIYFKNLVTGAVYVHNGDESFHPASIIKLPVFMAINKMVSQEMTSFDEKIKVTFDRRVPSCGAFNGFTDEPVVDIATLCNLMITISDNTAANIIIDYYSIETLNGQFREMGLEKTHLERRFYDDVMQEKGYNNKITPKEIGGLLEKVYLGKFIDETVSKNILEVLLEQQCRSKIPAYIEDICPVGNKSGEAGGITGDAAVVLGGTPYILVVIANETYVPETDDWIRHLSRDVFKEVKDGRL